jgi:hypothetical protein
MVIKGLLCDLTDTEIAEALNLAQERVRVTRRGIKALEAEAVALEAEAEALRRTRTLNRRLSHTLLREADKRGLKFEND